MDPHWILVMNYVGPTSKSLITEQLPFEEWSGVNLNGYIFPHVLEGVATLWGNAMHELYRRKL